MTLSICDLLGQIDTPGSFATRLRVPADGLDIEVKGVGRLTFPIKKTTVQKLRTIARPSPYGLRDKTLHDPRVRNSLEIPASRLKLDAKRFQPVLAQQLKTLRTELGFPDGSELKARLDKLLLYEEGQFFKAHQDSEKHDDMVATLVVILPSEYSGGAVTIEHRGQTKTFRRLSNQAKDISLLAFYADCFHAVSPIKSGVRVALTYRLSLVTRSTRTAAPVDAELVDRLTVAMKEHFDTAIPKKYSQAEPEAPERLVYLLDHEYTQHSLSWSRLKNSDAVRVAALRAAAERLDCECFLAQADVHESWMCEEENYPGGYYARRGWRHDYDDYDEYDEEDDDSETYEEDADDDDEHELIELLESSIELEHWVDSAGKHVEGIPGMVGDDELHFTKASSELKPYNSEHEGYQGNYGNTLDRWYRRAAFVTWPKSNTFALRAQASPQWAVDELLALPRNDVAELESRVKLMLPRWGMTARQVEGKGLFAKLLQVALRIADPDIAYKWLAPVKLRNFTTKTLRSQLASLVDRHGFPWAKQLFTGWTDLNAWESRDWSPLLADLCMSLTASNGESGTATTHWWLERELNHALGRCTSALENSPVPWLDLETFAGVSKQLAHVFAAAIAVSSPAMIENASKSLLETKQAFPTSFFVQLLQACLARSPALGASIVGSPLHRACTERIEALLNIPERGEDDWKILFPLKCSCDDCKALTGFLASERQEYDWPLNKDRRQHVHHTIDASKLPVRHTTLRTGRPHVLQLRKDRTLFTRERDYRASLKKMLSALSSRRAR